ncbi:MAG: histone [Candidatus Thorarchaeota archaeon]
MVKKPKRKAGFASARVEKVVRDAGAFRVSADAIYRLNDILTEYAMNIARYAVEIAKHSGRKTVQESDIKLAATK